MSLPWIDKINHHRWPIPQLNLILNREWNGAFAVTLFFVLSGHVLSLSLCTKQVHPIRYWPKFVGRRILRIYPAMWVCILFCFFYLLFIHQSIFFDAASKGYYEIWQRGAPPLELLKNILLLDNYLNPVTWTLELEILASLLLPVLMYLKIKSPKSFFCLLLVWICYFVFNPLYIYFRSGFIFMFMLGMYAQEISIFLKEMLNDRKLRLLSITSILIASNTHFFIADTYTQGWLIMALFSTLLISSILAISEKYSLLLLDAKISNYLGKISFSFYLWHLLILYAIGTAIFQYVDNQLLLKYPLIFECLLFSISTILTLPIATLSYEWIEYPTKSYKK